jgi:hypothetical protein
MFTYGYGGVQDDDHKARMEAIASTLPPEMAQWYLKTTLATKPRVNPYLRLALAQSSVLTFQPARLSYSLYSSGRSTPA